MLVPASGARSRLRSRRSKKGGFSNGGDDQRIVVLRCTPNPALLMLHTLLTARVNPLATGSRTSAALAPHAT